MSQELKGKKTQKVRKDGFENISTNLQGKQYALDFIKFWTDKRIDNVLVDDTNEDNGDFKFEQQFLHSESVQEKCFK